MKTIKKGFDGTVLTASKLPQSKVNLEGFKLLKVVIPAMGAFTDAMSEDNSRLYASVFSLVAHHSSVEHFENLQALLLGTLLDDNLNAVQDADTYLDNLNINSLDVLFWLFQVQLLQPLMASKVFEQVKPLLKSVKETFNLDSLETVESTEGA